jgi:CRP-like cAMP-binding protein
MTQSALDLLGTQEPSRAGLRDRVLLLRSVQNFVGLDQEALTLLAEHGRHRAYAKGDVLTEEGTMPESIHILVDGQVTVTRKKSPLVMKGGRGGVGVLAVHAGVPTRRAVCDEATRTFEIPAAAYKIALEESFALLRNTLRMAARSLIQSRGSLPADPTNPPAIEVGPYFAEPKTFAERLLEFRRGLFATINLDAVVDLTRSMIEVRVPAGHVFWSVGDPSTSLLNVDHGRLRCEAADGSHLDVGSNFTLGVMDILSLQPRSYSARAETDVIAYRMNAEDLLVVLEMHVHVALDLLREFAREMLDND